MSHVTLKEILKYTRKEKYGIPCLAGFTLEMIIGIIKAAEECRSPIIICYNHQLSPDIPIEIEMPLLVSFAEKSRMPVAEVCNYLHELNMYLTLELEPYLFLIVNSTYQMLRMIEEVDAPNLFANIDIGHLAITKESPVKLKKLKNYILHAHISDNGGEKHANAIIGSGCALIKECLYELINMNLDEFCKEKGEVMVAALELGEIGQKIEDLDFYVSESINYIHKFIPELIY